MDTSRHSFHSAQPLGTAAAIALSDEIHGAPVAGPKARTLYPEHFAIAAILGLCWAVAGWRLLG